MTDHNARQAGLTSAAQIALLWAASEADNRGLDLHATELRAILAAHSADARSGEAVAMQVLREIIAHDDAWEKETQTSRVSTTRADEYLAEFMALKDKARALLAAPAAPAPNCVCGQPETLNAVHRTDGPCYAAPAPAAPAPKCDGTAGNCPNECSEPCSPAPVAQADEIVQRIGAFAVAFAHKQDGEADKHMAAIRAMLAAPATPAEPVPMAIEWEPMPEDACERAAFDRNLDLYQGDTRVAVATALRLWSATSNASFGRMCCVFANEVAKMHVAPVATPADAASEADKRDALLEALKDARSVLSSINAAKHHEVIVNDEPVFWQRKEWVEWAQGEVLPKVDAAIQRERQQGADRG